MKYINKNLPILAKDSIITADISPMWTNLHIEVFNKKICCTDGILKVLISEGWIEPIKPREWWQILDRRGSHTYGNRYETKKEAEKYAEQLGNDGSLEIIKVQEVIE